VTSHRQRLDRWLRQQAFGDYGNLTRLTVKHSAQGTKGSVVGEHRVERITSDDIRECADTLENMVNDDAGGMGGMQRYVIESWHDDGETASARFAVRVQGYDPDMDNLDSEDAEPPTRSGALSQQMRHNEVIMKTLVAGMGGAIQSLQRSAARNAELVETLMAQRMEDFKVVEEALSHKHERELSMMEQTAEIERKDKLIEKGLTLLPAVVNRISGRELVAAPSPRDAMLKGLVDTLTPDQLNAIAGQLNPEQQIVLLEMLQAFQRDDETKLARANGSKSGGKS
jgi:hypothetical protein